MNRRHKLLLCSVFFTAIFLFFISLALFMTNPWIKTLLAFVFACGIAIPITGNIDSTTKRKWKAINYLSKKFAATIIVGGTLQPTQWNYIIKLNELRKEKAN